MNQILLFIGFMNILLPAFKAPAENKYNHISATRDTLPLVLTENRSDLVECRLKKEAAFRFSEHQLPFTKADWQKSRSQIRDEVIHKSGIVIDHRLPLNYTETGSIKMKGYTIRKIFFQTRPGVYTTANLYVPDGTGPFPAVINMHGHWREGRMGEMVQAVAHSLVLNGYVCLSIDAFGAGERSTEHGIYEYHGYGLGASLMDIGETLLGIQVSDNMRGVDLLCSLPYVDSTKIGATGASGGGNQTIWLSAFDERIKACMPVVSVATFESYVMNDNCICELPVDALTFTEEAGIIALVAPRAIKMCNHLKDDIPAFFPAQMIRTYNNARPIFEMLGVQNNISYQLFDSTHGYWQADREALLGWFNYYLKGKGNGTPVKDTIIPTLPDTQLMVFPKGHRDPKVESIATYCKHAGIGLRTNLLTTTTFNTFQKRKELRNILRINENSTIEKVLQYPDLNGWNRFALRTNDDKLIPMLHAAPRNQSAGYVVVCNSKGKSAIPAALINHLKQTGAGLLLIDLYGTGEASSPIADSLDSRIQFHTLSRSDLLLGRTILGEWVNDLALAMQFLRTKYNPTKISIDATKDAGVAALFLSSLNKNIDHIVLRETPVSYLFDNRENVDFYSMGIHLPGILKWGDISLAAALSGLNILFTDPLTMSGGKLNGSMLKEYQLEFKRLRRICNQPGKTVFN